MKRLTISSFFLVLALSLSSCSTHLGLSKVLSGNSSSKNSSGSAAKHRKSTGTSLTPSGSPSPGSTPQASVLTVGHGKSVSITSSGFQPNVLKAKTSKTVTWTNNDTVPQSVTSDQAGLFDSGSLQPGATFSFTFTGSGTFKYHSTTDPSFNGAVIMP